VLVQLGLPEQRHKAVIEVLNGATLMDVARRYGVARQTLHDWVRCYARNGMAALSDRCSKSATCPHQMPPEVEAPVCLIAGGTSAGDSNALRHELARDEVIPVPSRSAVYRALVRHTQAARTLQASATEVRLRPLGALVLPRCDLESLTRTVSFGQA
jgi:hypothetical protein